MDLVLNPHDRRTHASTRVMSPQAARAAPPLKRAQAATADINKRFTSASLLLVACDPPRRLARTDSLVQIVRSDISTAQSCQSASGPLGYSGLYARMTGIGTPA